MSKIDMLFFTLIFKQFLTFLSSSGIMIAILACARIYRTNSRKNNLNSRPVLLVVRDAHKSVFESLSLAQCDAVLIPCLYDDEFQLSLGANTQLLIEVLQKYSGKVI
jgi:arginine/lysine/ornithine decarboxylase